MAEETRQQRSVRLTPDLWHLVDTRRVELRLPSANAYIEDLIRKDLSARAVPEQEPR